MTLFRSALALSTALAVLVSVGCGGSRPNNQDVSTGAGPGPGPGAGPGPATAVPLLIGVEPDPLLISTGDVITIVGLNISSDLGKNVVNFISGGQRIPGIPVSVDFPSDGNPSNGLESELRVVVPGGVSTGNVELRVNGLDAGSRGYDARPQLAAWTLGRNETQTFLVYNPLLGFNQQASFVKLFGLNFNEIEEIQVEDSQGGQTRISPNSIERNPAPPPGTPTDLAPTGYAVIGFNLKDNRNDVRLNFVEGRRQNMRVRIKGAAGLSNTLEIPVHSDQNAARLGMVINGIKVPTGVRTGQVRIHYTTYDIIGPPGLGSEINYRMETFWKFQGEDDSLYRLAKPALDDPEQSGINNAGSIGILSGSIVLRSQHRLLPGGGSFHTFTWDAPNDPEFKRALNQRVDGNYANRFAAVQFLLRPTVEPNNNPPPRLSNYAHEAATPTVLYYYLEDRAGDLIPDQRQGFFSENFETDLNEDRLTTADYGPPSNPGALSGATLGPNASRFGAGTVSLVLRSIPPEDLLDGTTAQYILINTDDGTVVQRQLLTDNGTPCNPDDDELNGGGNGQSQLYVNPGSPKNEFELASLMIDANTLVMVRGRAPFVLRLSGTVDSPDEAVFVMEAGSRLDMNGCPGEDGPRPGPSIEVAGNGGAGGPGGGVGGLGASVLDAAGGPFVIAAEAGGQDGGGGGETTMAVDASIDPTKGSKIPGGPGGGGGNRTAGQRGDSGLPAPPRFAPPRAGRGGRARGTPNQLLISAGSGGGGGGGLFGTLNNNAAFNAGAGGGGGGGAFRLVANGKVRVAPNALLEANGGRGGNAVRPAIVPPIDGMNASSPGGGGSGGAIIIQARGSVEVPCESLQVNGGTGGTSPHVTNKLGGAGLGGMGWIRVESAGGGVPSCAAFAAETALTADLKTETNAKVTSTQGFPASGRIRLLSNTGAVLEEIDYLATTPTTFEGVVRPTKPPTIPNGSRVVLVGGIAPLGVGVLSGNRVQPSPDVVDVGRGRDGEVHIRYEPSVDSVTGEPIRDPVTGVQLSIWTFNTDTGTITSPGGDVLLEVAGSDLNPGRLECTRLVIDANTILVGVGNLPLQIHVTGVADIGGTIDVSGTAGGMLRFLVERSNNPEAGLGGVGGPGGGDGGDGGYVKFVNGNLNDKTPTNTLPVHGGLGLAPVNTPEGWDQTASLNGNENLEDLLAELGSFVRAGGGFTQRGLRCGGAGEGPCLQSAGGGGSGGNFTEGADGTAFPEPIPLFGQGATAFGMENPRFDGEILLLGGLGGGGGGGNPHVSGAYQAGYGGANSYRFRNTALHSPGTGGGGGGGALLISAQSLTLRPTARLLARGGNAFAGIDLSGNAGAGAGGTIHIQVKGAFTLEQGALIDVSGGVANLVPIPGPGQTIPDYPGNVHDVGGSLQIAGGAGGDGSPGRIRIEAEVGSLASLSGVNSSYSSGPFLQDTVASTAVSRAIRVGVGPGQAAGSHQVQLSETLVRYFDFGQPNGTDSAVTWQGAAESLDVHGAVGPFSALTGAAGLLGTHTPGTLPDREFIRFVVPFLSNGSTRETQVIQEIRLDYRLPSALELQSAP